MFHTVASSTYYLAGGEQYPVCARAKRSCGHCLCSLPLPLLLFHIRFSPLVDSAAPMICSMKLAFFTLSLALELLSVSAYLSTRNEESAWPGPNINGVFGLLDGIYEGGKSIIDYFSDGNDATTLTNTDQNSPVRQPTSSDGSQGTQNQGEPPFKVQVTSTQEKCDSRSESLDKCPKGDYIIYPLDCAGLRNTEITDQLTGWHVVFKISTNKECGGIFFWLAKQISVDQVNTLKGMTDIVEAVAPNEVGQFQSSIKTQEPNEEKISKPTFERRDYGDSVSIQIDAPKHLTLISSSSANNDFFYFSKAGQGVTLYVIDSGAEPHTEFVENSVIKYWLHSICSDGVESDFFDGHGTCVLSAATGELCGPAKKMKAVVVKLGLDTIAPEGGSYISIGCFLDAFQKVADDLYDRMRNGEKVLGYTIINLSSNLYRPEWERTNLEKMETLLKKLIQQYQVIITVVSGNWHPGIQSLRIHEYPALFAPDIPLIVVGGVDVDTGTIHKETIVGAQMTILAPFQVRCAGADYTDFQTRTGTSFSAPIVAGVLGGMLSGQWGDRSRRRMREPGFTMAAAARDYVQYKGRKVKYSNYKSVSNGLEAKKGPPLYGWTLY